MHTAGEKQLHLAWFITGHGYGHAIRSAIIANCFRPDTMLTIFSSVPDAFFSRELFRPYTRRDCRLDCGCLQSDFVTVDQRRTLETYAAIADGNEKNIAEIAGWCRSNRVDGIISDIARNSFCNAN